MSRMLKSTGAMGLATLASRILGMGREIVYANFMGDTAVAGAFKTALMIPNLFRRLLGEGALTAAFIPIFKEKERTEGEGEMWRAANAVISGLFIAASGIILVVIAGITAWLWWNQPEGISEGLARVAPELAFNLDPPKAATTRLMLDLARIMFPYMLLACLAAVFIGMLNSRGKFFVPALGASILNIFLIGSVLVAAPFFGDTLDEQIYAVAYAVLIAGVAQLLYQLPALLKEGYRPAWVNPFKNAAVQHVVKQMLPGMLGVAAFQFNVLTTTAIAYWINPTIVASYDYAVRLMEFPQGIFGVSLATYLLPTLAGLAAEKKYPEFRATYKQAAGYLFFANLIASVFLVVLAEPMIRLLFQHGAFDAGSTERASFALACLGPGLLAFSMVNISARAFYALGDTHTPMKISAFCLVLNVAFAVVLVPILRQGGMGIANTMSAALNVGLLIYALKRKFKALEFSDMRPLMLQMLGAAALAGVVTWAVHGFWEDWRGTETLFARLGAVFVPIGAGSLVYIGVLLWMRVPQAHDIWDLLRRRRKPDEPED